MKSYLCFFFSFILAQQSIKKTSLLCLSSGTAMEGELYDNSMYDSVHACTSEGSECLSQIIDFGF